MIKSVEGVQAVYRKCHRRVCQTGERSFQTEGTVGAPRGHARE